MVDLKVGPAELKAFLKSLEEKRPNKEPKGPKICENCIYYNSKGYCGIVDTECVNSPTKPGFRKKD